MKDFPKPPTFPKPPAAPTPVTTCTDAPGETIKADDLIGPATPPPRPDRPRPDRPRRGVAPPKPEDPNPPKSVNRDDVSFILDAMLKKSHRDDPTVIGFIASYIQCRDVAQASRAVGIHPNSGRALRNRKDIHNAITKITDVAVMKYGLDTEEIVSKVAEVMTVDLAEFENEDGTYKTSLRELPPEIRRAVKKFKVKNIWERDANGMKEVVGQLVEVELYDKLKATELLGREKSLFKETKKLEHDVTADMKAVLLETRERAEAARLPAAREVIEIEGEVSECT